MNTNTELQALAQPDPTLADAAQRAMHDCARQWADANARLDDDAAGSLRNELAATIASLGFADILGSPDQRDAWPDAAAVLRAAASTGVPLDLALWIVTGEQALAVVDDPRQWNGMLHEPALNEDQSNALVLARMLQTAAASEAAIDLAIDYVGDRKQFGRALAKFQAIQHSLAVAAEHAAQASAAVEVALACVCAEGIASPRSHALLDCAALVTDDAVDVVYDITHQVHGAIGFTREYALHRYTVDLQRWRESILRRRGHGAARRLGERVARHGVLWHEVTSLMQPA